MNISLGSWAFSFGPFADNPIPFEETVKRLSKAGYDGIEICGFPPHVTLDRYPTAECRKQLVKFLRDHQLGVSGYAADFTSVNPVAPSNKQKYLDLFRRNAEFLHARTSEMRSELGTLIARNHEEIDVLRRMGERDYVEFTITGRNKPQRVGAVTVELRSVDIKKNKFTVALVVNDLRTEKKDRTVNEPILFYPGGSIHQANEFVVNSVAKNKITGYISVPKNPGLTSTVASGN